MYIHMYGPDFGNNYKDNLHIFDLSEMILCRHRHNYILKNCDRLQY